MSSRYLRSRMRMKAFLAVSKSKPSRASWANTSQSPSVTPRHAILYASLQGPETAWYSYTFKFSQAQQWVNVWYCIHSVTSLHADFLPWHWIGWENMWMKKVRSPMLRSQSYRRFTLYNQKEGHNITMHASFHSRNFTAPISAFQDHLRHKLWTRLLFVTWFLVLHHLLISKITECQRQQQQKTILYASP